MFSQLKTNAVISRILLFSAAIVMFMVILGAATSQMQYGRYQAVSWSTRFDEGSGGCGVFVTDTVTGETRIAYTLMYGVPAGTHQRIDNLRKPFALMKK